MAIILAYTFRTFPYPEELRKEVDSLFIFGKLKEDVQRFSKLIFEQKPTMIIGVASTHSGHSLFEPKAVNRFNRTGIVIKEGEEELLLNVPDLQSTTFRVSRKPSSTFCNYTMYRIKSFLEREKLTIPFAFTHVKREDIKRLKEILLQDNFTRAREFLSSTG
ncbi:hypothetical protein HYT55_00635 [Candidatus Woesearchaeota archaeon]|nr:hypothetical protein [Candidatus Woesearchaeota archaeon]